ncbi:DNA-binding SARP family transcriptional activator [Saccharothrix carnea]|uniref:DNA-binding SARP family transcriptional activator n=1 Tax=Saccharothrix carnea TaxID=1280637 RepID=A0A2P8I8E8_SACCR|nr:AfsR/SARP family transcriptional regulator [Saccharothrix carnea]PSL54751.1 DNA-binding SARP family transcriptional activator [Saccharothrix carnea]
MTTEFRVLGPLEVRHAGRPVAVPAGKSRVLLAALLLRAGEVVTAGELVDRLWDGGAPDPARARATLQMTVTRLRRALGQANVVRTAAGGYLADVPADALDLHRFRSLVDAGRYAEALALWRGAPLSDVRSDALHRLEVVPLEEERLDALARRIDADLAAGAAHELVAELRSLTRAHPLRERFRAQLMLALYRSERQAEALAAYREAREVLAGELGVEPGRELRELHERILLANPDLVPARSVVPHLLPSRGPYFVGRDEESAELSAGAEAGPGVVVVGGMAGVGKTAFAVHWANLAAEAFTGGRLYANLRGFDPSAEPVPPGEVLRGFLDALDVPSVPAGFEAQVAAFRRAVEGRKLLIVLDNARDAEQVRPLVPDGAFVVVTSRDRLAGLGARSITLEPLDDVESRALLERRLGPERLAEEAAATGTLVELCAGLPLALAVVATRAAVNPHFTLADVADQLAVDQELLDHMDTGEEDARLCTVFSWSYRLLGPMAARVFRLLGHHRVPSSSVSAAAAVAGLPVPDAEAAIAELTAAHLLSGHASGRYSMHPLLRRYAAELADAEGDDVDAADRRALTWYAHTAANAVRWLTDEAAPVLPAHDCVRPDEFTSAEDASAWLDAEWEAFVLLVRAGTTR